MSNKFIAKPRINSKNHQINIAIPKKIITKELLDKILKGNKLKITLK